MKVLFITHVQNMAGANRSMLQLILELRSEYNVDPWVLIPNNDIKGPSIEQELINNDIPYIRAHIPFFKNKFKISRKFYLKYILSIPKLAKQLKGYHFDLIHSNSCTIDVGGYLSRLMGVKHIWHLREFGDLDYGFIPVFGRWYERFTYKNGDAFIAVSERVKDHFLSMISSSKIYLIYNGIFCPPDLPLAQHQSEKLHFLCAGLMCDGKNQLEILMAVKWLFAEIGEKNFDVTFVGSQTDYTLKMHEYIHQNGLESCCKILEEVNGISDLASCMDVGIMSSHCEAFGRVTVEYMLHNLAVIANNQGANPEIIENGKSGLIYNAGDIHELATCMLRLIKDRALLVFLSTNGRICAQKKFLSKYNTKAIYELYLKLITT